MKTNTMVMAVVVLTMMAIAVLPVGAQSAGPDFQVTLNPSDGQSVGNSVNIHIKVNSSNPGATRIIVSCGGVSKGETSEVEFDSNWNTGGCSSGNQQITIQARNPDDPNWSNPNTKTFNYNLTGSSQPPTPVPPPTPPKGPNISIFDFSPSSANVGDQVNIHIKVDSSNPGATKLTVSCGSISKNETSEVEFDTTWFTSGCPVGNQTVTVLSRDVNDPNWANPSSATRSYNLSAPPIPVQSPTANFWADSGSVLQGQCTYLHWDTANAVSVDIDGSGVNTSGETQVCPNVTQKFTLTAHASPGGNDAQRNITITVTAAPQPPAVADSFQTGNVISIGGNIYVIVDGRRRHVPNPATLDALGIGQNLINNKGFSDSQLSQIIQGPDIPDVNIDPTGVASFRAAYLPNLIPIVPKPPTQVPTAVPPVVQPTAQPNVAPMQPTVTLDQQPQLQILLPLSTNLSYIDQPDGWDPGTEFGFLDVRAGEAQDLFLSGQCTWFVAGKRDDVQFWIGDRPRHAYLWDDRAKQSEYARRSGIEVVKIPQIDSIAVWEPGCDGAGFNYGHVAYVTGYDSSSNRFSVNEANWNSKRPTDGILVQSCMSFITFPKLSALNSQPQNELSFWEKIWQSILSIFK
jgi:surface antigen